ncbi:hypothetical protein ACI2JA_04085 [Alkalihalobacillus sp. NPDC078783]
MVRRTNTKQVNEENTEVVEKEVKPKRHTTPAKKVRKQIDPHRLVPCKNVTSGGVTYRSKKTGNEYRWELPGDVEDVEVQELRTMVSSNKSYTHTPWILIDEEEDADVIEYLGLKRLYSDLILPDEIDDLLLYAGSQALEERLEKLPKGSQAMIRDRAIELRKNNQLDSIGIIQVIKKYIKIDLLEIK